MSSFARNLQRKQLRQGSYTTDADGSTIKVDYEPSPQRLIMLPEGGYITVRYTRGPIRVSAARLRAQGKLAEIQNPGIMREQARAFARAMGGPTPKKSKVWRTPAAASTVPDVVTRQQVRFARRKGLPIPTVEVVPVKSKRARKSATPAQAA